MGQTNSYQLLFHVYRLGNTKRTSCFFSFSPCPITYYLFFFYLVNKQTTTLQQRVVQRKKPAVGPHKQRDNVKQGCVAEDPGPYRPRKGKSFMGGPQHVSIYYHYPNPSPHKLRYVRVFYLILLFSAEREELRFSCEAIQTEQVADQSTTGQDHWCWIQGDAQVQVLANAVRPEQMASELLR